MSSEGKRGRKARHGRSRARIIESAARLFREDGYNGIGLMAIMKEADLTPGAFYALFQSKEHLFAEVVGMEVQFSMNLAHVHELFPDSAERVIGAALDPYLGDCTTDTVFATCSPASLTGDIARSGPEVRARFETEMRKLFDEFAERLPQEKGAQERIDKAIVTLALCSGAIALAKSMADEELAARILRVCRTATIGITGARVPALDEFPPGTAPPNAR